MALSTGSLYNQGLDRVFRMAARAGYDGVELLVDARQDAADVPYLRSLIERNEMPVLSVHSPFVRRVDGWPAAPEGRILRALELAEALGAETVIAHTPMAWHHLSVLGTWLKREIHVLIPGQPAAEARYARWLCEELADVQKGTPIRIAIENMPAGNLLGRRVAKCLYSRPLELRRWPHLVFDTTHWGTWGVEPLAAYGELKDRIVHMHLSDFDGEEHRLPFRGHLDLTGLLGAMRRDAFGGIVCVEVSPWAIAGGVWEEEALHGPLQDTAARCRELLGTAPSHSHTACKRPRGRSCP